jgi:hypothetical protein
MIGIVTMAVGFGTAWTLVIAEASDTNTAKWVSIVTLATLVIERTYSAIMESRRRQWALDDADRKERKMDEQSKKLDVQRQELKEVKTELRVNTDVALATQKTVGNGSNGEVMDHLTNAIDKLRSNVNPVDPMVKDEKGT